MLVRIICKGKTPADIQTAIERLMEHQYPEAVYEVAPTQSNDYLRGIKLEIEDWDEASIKPDGAAIAICKQIVAEVIPSREGCIEVDVDFVSSRNGSRGSAKWIFGKISRFITTEFTNDNPWPILNQGDNTM